MAIVFSVDKFMSEVRALTNITSNGIATVFVWWWWEDELDHERWHANLNKTIDRSDVETAITTGWRGRKVIKARSKARFVAWLTYVRFRKILTSQFKGGMTAFDPTTDVGLDSVHYSSGHVSVKYILVTLGGKSGDRRPRRLICLCMPS